MDCNRVLEALDRIFFQLYVKKTLLLYNSQENESDIEKIREHLIFHCYPLGSERFDMLSDVELKETGFGIEEYDLIVTFSTVCFENFITTENDCRQTIIILFE